MARQWTSERPVGSGEHHRDANHGSIESPSSLRIIISGEPTKEPRWKASKQGPKVVSSSVVTNDLKSNWFRPALDGRADRTGRVRYRFEEYCLKDGSEPKRAGEERRSSSSKSKWRKQEEELRGIFLSDANDTYLSRGRDGYNSPFDCVLAKEMVDFAGVPKDRQLPMERFLTTPGPWTHLSSIARVASASIPAI